MTSDGPAAGQAPGPLALTAAAIVIGFRRGDGELRLQLEEVLLPDAADVHQLLDLLERTVLLPVLDDAGGGFRADAGQPFEIGGRGGVEIDDSGDAAAAARLAVLDWADDAGTADNRHETTSDSTVRNIESSL